jgi:predicted house-cleaning noncanonical NTP pyrophosphatase (MazG superfamily)|uniref:Uncharacterized protein n=1 Tax=virus sp. ctML55 TaxID=2827627 RepID=A0A8S5RIC9_9VIRU|nr:MAG: hypothetical protein [Bacteriophage sp.]UWI21689.1 MAG: hypothetical protein [Bacteriophage sp.]DAE30732.1 MAG TPA: hypothetical protein [virus sp. ctML55]DAV51746.1 MAG TPA: hypothetical protein [Bacteriophage sp.]
MTLNDVLTKQNVITKIILKDGDKELPKELKVKIMRIRMAYNKIKKQFDDDTQEFTNQIISDELRELANKSERTPEEEARFNELNDKTNSEYQEYLIQKGFEEVKDTPDDVITMEEYSDILDVNSGNDVEINGNSVKAADLMEIVFDLFVK